METCVRHDWYQTETHVVVSIMLKHVKPENIRMDITENALTFCAKDPTGVDCTLSLRLAHAVVPNKSSWKVLSSKIEIKLKKAEGIRWLALEKDKDTLNEDATNMPAVNSTAMSYPSSRPQKKDWDRLELELKKEEAEEKVEGEAAINKLFNKIYIEGSDDVKRAMNKSFMESGGTVLSTNWKDVGDKKIEVKPPDGMEWKKWDS